MDALSALPRPASPAGTPIPQLLRVLAISIPQPPFPQRIAFDLKGPTLLDRLPTPWVRTWSIDQRYKIPAPSSQHETDFGTIPGSQLFLRSGWSSSRAKTTSLLSSLLAPIVLSLHVLPKCTPSINYLMRISISGPSRECSWARMISGTLVLLASWGNWIFNKGSGIS